MRILSLVCAAVLMFAATSSAQHDHGGMNTMPMSPALTDSGYLVAMAARYQEGIELARLAVDRTNRVQVRELAVSLVAAQQDELKTLDGLMTPETAVTTHEEMHRGAGTSSTTITTADLERASAKTFDRVFLGKMIKHYQESVALTRSAALRIDSVQDYARRASLDQQKLVKEMQRLKKQIG